MSGLLLDTHVLLWWLSDPAGLSPAAREAIADPARDALVSAAATWEIAIKRSLGRLECPDDLLEAVAAAELRLLPIGGAHTLATEHLPWLHQDPFDRVQIAQAQEEGLTLVTRDERVRQYDVPTLAA